MLQVGGRDLLLQLEPGGVRLSGGGRREAGQQQEQQPREVRAGGGYGVFRVGRAHGQDQSGPCTAPPGTRDRNWESVSKTCERDTILALPRGDLKHRDGS